MRSVLLCFFVPALLASWFPALSHAQTLTAETTAAPYHTVVHLFASAAPAGTLTFADNGTPVASLNVTPQGTAVLALANLTPGPHTLTAGASNSVTVTVAPAPSAFQFTADNAILFQHSALNFAITGLPPRATGTLTYAEDGNTFATVPLLPSPATPYYQAFGDSITSGYTLADRNNRYPNLFAAANSFTTYYNYADTAAESCDVLAHYILPVQIGPSQDFAPLSTLMIGASDMDNFGVAAGEANFITCHRAALAWLAIPREFKVLPGDPALTVLSGTWALPPAQFDSTYGTLYNSSGSGAAAFQITSNGGPLYLWYLIGDFLAGSFTVSVDNVPTGTTYTTNLANPIASRNNPDSVGFALLKLPVAPGPHTLRVDMLSGTVGLLAAATPPSPGNSGVHPTVFSSDITNQNILSAAASSATILQFSADALADATSLRSDGLDIRTVPTHAFLGTTPAEFFDYGHPSILGHQHLAAAFQSAFGTTSPNSYLVFPAAIPRQIFVANTLGTHTYTAAYSGDSIYAPATASVSVQIVADSQSVTTLSAPATTFYAGHPVQANAVIFPPNPGSSVTLMEGAHALATAPVAYDSAAFALSTLAPGIHTLYAAYAGDSADAASVSPPIAVNILQNPSTLTLSTAAELPYGSSTALTVAVQPAAASGTVTFNDSFTPSGRVNAQSSQPLGQATLAGGTATLTVSSLLPGTHTITAVYSGDANDSPAASAAAVTLVDLAPTTTLLSAAPAPFGQPSTFTASVSPAAATGTITFADGVTVTQIALNNGLATWTSQTLTPGLHNVSAAYSGDSTRAASTSATLAATVPRDASTVSLSVAAASPYPGDPITFTAILAPAAASGTVVLSDSTSGALGQAAVVNGIASLTVPAPAAGTHSITATYSGDPDTLPATSPAIALQVLSRTTTTTLTAPATTVYGDSVTLSASVAPVPAGGLLRFFDHGSPLGDVTLANGVASITTASLGAGTHALSATYAGDSSHNPSTGTATLIITPTASLTSVSLSQPSVLAGSPVLLTVRVSAVLPTGTVTLRSGAKDLASATLTSSAAGTAYATLSLPTAAPGTYPVAAFYSGDSNTAASDSSAAMLAYTVVPRFATGTFNLSATQVPPQTPVTLTAAFTSPATSGPALIPTGTVTFLNGQVTLATVPLDASGSATTTLPSATLGTHTLSAVYTPSGVFSATPIFAQTLTVTPPLALAFAVPSVALAPSASADAAFTLTPLSGFSGAVALQCASPQTYLACTVDSPTSLSGPTTAKVHLTASSTLAALTLPRTLIVAFLLPLVLLRRRRLAGLTLCLLAATLSGCAEGGNFNSVPAGTYVVQLTATAANTPTTTTLTVNLH